MGISGYVLVVLTSTISGQGASSFAVPGTFNSFENCKHQSVNLTTEGEAFGMRLDVKGVCIKVDNLPELSQPKMN